MPKLQGAGKAQSQATAVATVTGDPTVVVWGQATSLSVSKGAGTLTRSKDAQVMTFRIIADVTVIQG